MVLPVYRLSTLIQCFEFGVMNSRNYFDGIGTFIIIDTHRTVGYWRAILLAAITGTSCLNLKCPTDLLIPIDSVTLS